MALGQVGKGRNAARAQHARPRAQDCAPVLERRVGQQRYADDRIELVRQRFLVGPPAGDDGQRAELVGAELHGGAIDVARVDRGVRQRSAQHASHAAVVRREVRDGETARQPGMVVLAQPRVDLGELIGTGPKVPVRLHGDTGREDHVVRRHRSIDAPQQIRRFEARRDGAGGDVPAIVRPFDTGRAHERYQFRRGFAQAFAAGCVEVVRKRHELVE